jgi:hypothetical protein
MEPTTVRQPGVSEVAGEDETGTGKTEKAYGDRHFKPVITPGLLKSPIIPVWLSKRFRRK